MQCWMLTSVRSGSWYLANLLNQTGFFNPQFGEYLHWDYKKTEKYPKVCKVIRRHFLATFNDNSLSEIKANLPQLKCICLKREDNYARAISLYFSLLSKIWRTDVDRHKQRFIKESYTPWIPKLAQDCLAEVSSPYHNCWETFPMESYEIDYNDLIKNPVIELKKVLNYLDLPDHEAEHVVRLNESIPMTRPETAEYIDKLKELSPTTVHSDSSINVYDLIRQRYFSSINL